MSNKPPMGVIPQAIWMEKRLVELSTAIAEYINRGNFISDLSKWIKELNSLYKDYDEKVLEVNRVVQGFRHD